MLGSAESQVPKLIIREIIFEEFQRMSSQSTNITDGQTDRQTTYNGITALRYASRGKKNKSSTFYGPRGSYPPHSHLTPSLGVTPFEFRDDLISAITRVFGRLCVGEEIMSLTFLRNRLPVGVGCVYVLLMFFCIFLFCFCFFFVFFPYVKNMRQPFSGTAERIFMKLLPKDRGDVV